MRLRLLLGTSPFIKPSPTLKIEVHRVWVGSLFRAPRLGGDKLGVQSASQTRDDFVLHVEKIGEGLSETAVPRIVELVKAQSRSVSA